MPRESSGGGRSTTEIIRGLKDGTVAGKALGAEQRRACVERLLLEGVSVHEIADLLRVSDRTVRRDREKIRISNALEPSDNLAATVLGEYRQQADAAATRLARLQRDPTATAADKVAAVRASVEIYDRFIGRLIDLGMIGGEARSEARLVMGAELLHLTAVITGELGTDAPLSQELQRLTADLAGDTGGLHRSGER